MRGPTLESAVDIVLAAHARSTRPETIGELSRRVLALLDTEDRVGLRDAVERTASARADLIVFEEWSDVRVGSRRHATPRQLQSAQARQDRMNRARLNVESLFQSN